MTRNLNSSANCTKSTIKFLYSYGGRIIPRPTDGKLRYVGGYTRVLAVDRSVKYSELMVKFGESCGCSMVLKCKLPTEDLDLLISIKSDEELRIVIEEYDRVSPETKIVAVLYPIKSADKKVSRPPLQKLSRPPSPVSCFDFPAVPRTEQRRVRAAAACNGGAPPRPPTQRCCSPAVQCHVIAGKYQNCGRRNVPAQFCQLPQRDYYTRCHRH
ncbi:hypothetical protein BUALT_Bualt02G0136900 [Buddleja alternifolia]|uniref:PB1 domain-containing protein n=1 Tax=Buddleja alternifolia TaxID=168488 RepID=A0AAV6Y1K0_9LAMI|nr:hypothetical protein BUALT_Bualt02G0136900 [Buddleja alternifolia]